MIRGIVRLLAVVMVVGGCSVRPLPPEPPASPPAEPPQTVDGLPVITVSQALALREAGEAGQLAVGGWYSSAPVHPCPAPIGPDGKIRKPHPFEFYCRLGEWALTEQRETVADVTEQANGGMSVSLRTPASPWLQPAFVDSDAALFPPGARTWQPVAAILVGHFRDRSAATCPLEIQQDCVERFVVDRAIPVR